MTLFTIQNVKRINSSTTDGTTHSVTIENGKIKGWNLEPEVIQSGEIIDGCGHTIAPALIELHAHLREPGQTEKEDLSSGLAAAVAGGYGTVVCMPNTSPVIGEPEIVRQLSDKAQSLGLARLKPAAALSKNQQGEELCDLEALKEAGAAMFTDDGLTNENAHVLRLGLEKAHELGMVVSVHAEDATLRNNGVMNEGEVSRALGVVGNPVYAEAARVARDMEIVALTGARLHVQHLSNARALDIVRDAKKRGLPVTCEVCPHHLTLTDQMLSEGNPVYKVAPPLRTAADNAYLLEGLKDGTVDCIATDHAPHAYSEKQRPLNEAPSGIAYIELAFPLMYTRFAEQLGLAKIVELMTEAPARVMGWPKPTLEAGTDADLVLLDLETKRPVEPSTFKSKAKFTPWAGEVLCGWPVLTVVAGRVAYQHESFE